MRSQSMVFGRDPGLSNRSITRWSPGGTHAYTAPGTGCSWKTWAQQCHLRQWPRHPSARRGPPGRRDIGLGSYTFKLTDVARGTLEQRTSRQPDPASTRQLPGRRPQTFAQSRLSDDLPIRVRWPDGAKRAGKTTLMNALNGYTRPAQGEVLFNGQSLYANYAQFSTHIGYVPQDDIIHRDLTVGQGHVLHRSSRLPSDFSKADIQKRIRKVLKQLGLENAENVLIGSPEKKGISGGHGCVNLAMELLTDPLVLFLDKPTSGLSSEDALWS